VTPAVMLRPMVIQFRHVTAPLYDCLWRWQDALRSLYDVDRCDAGQYRLHHSKRRCVASWGVAYPTQCSDPPDEVCVNAGILDAVDRFFQA
jgi:hypothetical protein